MHETSVIGTYISGKYAQVLQSTSHIFKGNEGKPKIAPTQSLRVLKTAAPHLPKKTYVVESTTVAKQPSSASIESEEVEEFNGNSTKQNLVRNSRRPAISSNSLKNRFRSNRPSSAQKEDVDYTDGSSSGSAEVTTPTAVTPSSYKKKISTNKSPKR